MIRKLFPRTQTLLSSASTLMIAACSTLPAAGPSMSSLDHTPHVSVVAVTSATAAAMAASEARDHADALRIAMSAAFAGTVVVNDKLAVGDKFTIALWIYTVPTTGAGANVIPTAPSQQNLGTFVIERDGTTSLPYVGHVTLAGLTREAAEARLKLAYTAMRTMVGPAVSIQVTESPARDILVTGAVSEPRRLSWSPTGVTLAEALTAASGNGAGGLAGDTERGRVVATSHVEILRGDNTVASIPTPIALRSNVPLRPGDTLVIDNAAAVRVAILGGGAAKVGTYGFAEGSTLTDALANSSGLDGNTADARSTFVLRDNELGTPTLYSFPMRTGDGLIAARRFPMHNGDLIYIATAPAVAIGKVVSMLYGIAMPALLAK